MHFTSPHRGSRDLLYFSSGNAFFSRPPPSTAMPLCSQDGLSRTEKLTLSQHSPPRAAPPGWRGRKRGRGSPLRPPRGRNARDEQPRARLPHRPPSLRGGRGGEANPRRRQAGDMAPCRLSGLRPVARCPARPPAAEPGQRLRSPGNRAPGLTRPLLSLPSPNASLRLTSARLASGAPADARSQVLVPSALAPAAQPLPAGHGRCC